VCAALASCMLIATKQIFVPITVKGGDKIECQMNDLLEEGQEFVAMVKQAQKTQFESADADS
jgi:acetaldehyde dehydrogenase (acetylating)